MRGFPPPPLTPTLGLGVTPPAWLGEGADPLHSLRWVPKGCWGSPGGWEGDAQGGGQPGGGGCPLPLQLALMTLMVMWHSSSFIFW